MLELLDTSIVNVAIPHMMGNLGATLDEIAWVSTGYIVANVIILPITGWLSAFFGRRRYFAGSIAIFVIASFFCGNAHTLESLVAWRIIQGLGGGALLATSQAILYEEFPREEYGTAMAIFGVGVMVGPTLGPTLGGYITDAFGWPWIFYINIPLGMLALALSLTFIQNSGYQQRAERVDYIGLLLLALGIGTLQTMLERGERLDWFDSGMVTALGLVSAASLIVFVWHELTTEHPVVDLRILASRQLAVGVVFGGILGVCLYATVFVLPVYLQSLQGFTAEQTGFVILPGALASAFTMAVMGRLTGKFDARLSIMAGVFIFALSMWKHGHFTMQSGMADFFWPLIFRGVGLGLIFVPLTNLALADLPMSKIPNGTGLFNLMRQLGGSVGIAVSATLAPAVPGDPPGRPHRPGVAVQRRDTGAHGGDRREPDGPWHARRARRRGRIEGDRRHGDTAGDDALVRTTVPALRSGLRAVPPAAAAHASEPGDAGRGAGALMVQVGDAAPDFTLPDQDGKPVQLRQLLGRTAVVLYFYPKDATPGCTIEARTFQSAYDDFQQAGAEVIGISSDSVASHRRFAASEGLTFRLLSDRAGAVRELYGVEKTLGILPGRVTYVIDPAGIVRHIYSSQLLVTRHSTEAMEAVRALSPASPA